MPLPGLNEVIDACKKGPKVYARMKKSWGKTVSLYALQQKFEPITAPSGFDFEWFEKRPMDPDNISSGGRKIILDALQESGLLPNDNAKWMLSFTDKFFFGGERQGVRMTVRP